VKDVTRYVSNRTEISFYQKWEEDELELNKKFSATKDSVHASLCGKDECLICHPAETLPIPNHHIFII
jgi:hypothetical protein